MEGPHFKCIVSSWDESTGSECSTVSFNCFTAIGTGTIPEISHIVASDHVHIPFPAWDISPCDGYTSGGGGGDLQRLRGRGRSCNINA